MKKSIVLLLLLLALVSSSLAGTNGGTAGAFARVGAGARAQAMGNAFTAVADGPSAIYFNAGALPFQTNLQLDASTSHMALDRRLDYIGFVAPVKPKAGPEKKVVNAGIGLGWLHGSVGNIDSRDFDGNPLKSIDQSSNLFMFGFGLQFHERFGAGVTAKVVYETFGKIGGTDNNRSINGNGFGADLAAFAKPIDHLTVGAQLKNLGAKTTWNTTDYWQQGSSKSDKWPLEYRFGAAYERMGITGALDVESSDQNDTRLHAGLEAVHAITERQSIAGRVGYDDGAATFGVGIGFALWKLRSNVDFTYVLEDVAPNDATFVSWGVKF
jgi:hypothetical protein